MSELENHDEIAELEDMYLEALMEKLAEIEQLQAEAATLREALEAVMWASLESGHVYCQWCAVSEGEEHLSDCQGNNALSGVGGRELPERLERAERMLELLEAAGHVSPETVSQTRNIVLSFGVF